MLTEYNIDEIDPNEIVNSYIADEISLKNLFFKIVIPCENGEDAISTWDLVREAVLSDDSFLSEEFTFVNVDTKKADDGKCLNININFKHNKKISESQSIDILSDLEDSIKEEIHLDDYVNYSIEI